MKQEALRWFGNYRTHVYIDQKDELLEQLGLGYLGVGSNFIINK